MHVRLLAQGRVSTQSIIALSHSCTKVVVTGNQPQPPATSCSLAISQVALGCLSGIKP